MRILMSFFFLLVSSATLAQAPGDWSSVEKAFGRGCKPQDEVCKVAFPRTDLDVRIGATQVLPGAGLGSWMAFRRVGADTVVDGDLVLTSGEVDRVLSALVEGGVEVTALHNHILGEQPQVMYLHFFRKGALDKELAALREALSRTRTPTGPSTKVEPHAITDQKRIEELLGRTGSVNGSVLAFAFPRAHPIKMHAMELMPAMGMSTAINIQPSPMGIAATGDFVVEESQVQAVVAALRQGGVSVTAIHNHLLDEQPRTVFIHFWAEGKAEPVAKALRTALDAGR